MGDILHSLQRRYGDVEVNVAWSRLLLRQNRNRARLEVVYDQLSELTAERRRLVAEDERLETAKAALIDDIVDQTRIRHNEGWSPTPVVGYRVWQIAKNAVLGATGHRWDSPLMEADCRQARPDDDLPHTDHICSEVGHGCGIYAATRPSLVAPNDGGDWILGIVLLSGKVVEHELGFRAARARVAGVIAQHDGHSLVTADAGLIERLFKQPAVTLEDVGQPGDAPRRLKLIEAIEGLERSMDTWT